MPYGIDKFQGKQMKLRDERLKLMSEILNGIRIIKFYAWEKSMQKLVGLHDFQYYCF